MISAIKDIISDIAAGRMVIMVDDEGRENEGDLIIAADHVTPDAINFMARFGCGLICMPMAGALIDRLQLPQMVTQNKSSHGTAFTVSIGARHGITTGISAYDRAATVRAAINPAATPDDIVSPGHMFPLRAAEGGVLVRNGHTEAAVDLARLAGGTQAGVICEIMNEDGTMARLPQLIDFAKTHGLNIGTIADLVAYCHKQQKEQAA
jgi:3,4-dihydroxy 2-butanone 4-phosphate synthase/GTP cyclohydrolase II